MTTSQEEARETSVSEIKKIIDIITLIQSRVDIFQSELNFFLKQIETIQEEKIKDEYFCHLLIFALKRLDHEVIFLCIDTYSTHESILKKKFLFSKYIAGLGKSIIPIDKMPSDPKTYLLPLTWSDQEKEEFIKNDYEINIAERKRFRDDQKITSDMTEWKKYLITLLKDVEKLKKYRGDFAHRLDDIEKVKKELSISNSNEIQERINCASRVLETYKISLQSLVLHLTSKSYDGIVDFVYDSLSRLELFYEFSTNSKNEENESDKKAPLV